MIAKQIIDDQKKTIHRLQDECTEKTNAIIALGEQLQAKEQENEKLKKALKNFLACPRWCDDATVPDAVKFGLEGPENYSEQIVYNMSVALSRFLEAEHLLQNQ